MGSELTSIAATLSASWPELWTPGFSRSAIPLVLAGLAVVLVCAVWSSAWWTASSASDEGEAASFADNRGIVSRGGDYLITIVGLAVPALLFVGVFRTVFPAGEPTALLLVSREYGASPLAPDDSGVALSAWKANADGPAGDDVRLLDVGPLVDDVLSRAASKLTTPIRPDDPAVLRSLAELVVEATRAPSLERLVTQDTDNAIPSANASATAARLPAWLVESVELATLRLMAEQIRAARIAVLTAGRLDEFGRSTWSDAESYLRNAGTLADATDRVRVFDPAASESAPRLIAAASVQTLAGQPALAVSFVVPKLTASGAPLEDVVSLRAGLAPSAAVLGEVTLRRGARRTLQFHIIPLPPNLTSPLAEVAASNGGRSMVPVGRGRNSEGLVIRLIPPATSYSAWNETWRRLATRSGNDPWFDLAHDRLFGARGHFAGAPLSPQGDAADGDVIVDARNSDRGILVYVHKAGVAPPDVPSLAAPSSSDHCAWGPGRAEDPHMALANLPLISLRVSPPTFATLSKVLASPLTDAGLMSGLPVRRLTQDPAIFSVLRDSRPAASTGAERGRSVLWVGIDVEASGLTAVAGGPGQASPFAAAAFWSELLLAAPTVLGPASPDLTEEILDRHQRLALFLDESHVAQAAASVYGQGSRVLAWGCIAASGWGFLQVAIRRTRRS